MRADFAVSNVSIIRLSSGWIVAIPVILPAGMSLDAIKICLDPSMSALPPKLNASFSQEIGLQGLSVNRQTSGYKVSPDRREISWLFPRASLTPSVATLEAHFEWKHAALIPDKVSLCLISSIGGLAKSARKITGINISPSNVLRSRLVSFLSNVTRSNFHFSVEGDVSDGVEVDYDSFSPIVATAQKFPNTVVNGTTWPSEVAFWKSRNGLLFLAYQRSNLKFRDGRASKRLALCPYSVSANHSTTRAFLAELECQHKLGVKVGIMEAEQYLEHLSSSDALMGIGNQIGVLYRGVTGLNRGNPASTTLYLGHENTEYSNEVYKRAFRGSILWEEYKNKRAILFNKQEEDEILGRYLEIEIMSNEIRSRLAVSEKQYG